LISKQACKLYILLMLFFAIFLPNSKVYSQETEIKGTLRIPDSTNIQMLTTIDGTTVVGRIVEIGEDEIQFEGDIGKITIPVAKIKEIKEVPVSSIIKGVYWFPNPNETRLFFAPTARPLKGGEGYFADYYLFFPMVAYGLTDNIAIAGGTSFFWWLGIQNNLFYFMPKVGAQIRDNLALSVGALVIKLPSFGEESGPLVGICYGVGTVGGPNSNLTGGVGFGYVDWEFDSSPMLMLGGQHRVSRTISLVSENWMFPGVSQPLISYGLRFFGAKLSVDLGFLNTFGEGMIFPGMPYVGFVVKF
jgi:hypothetical protein